MEERNTKPPLVLFQRFGHLPHSNVTNHSTYFSVSEAPQVKTKERKDGLIKGSHSKKFK